MKKEILSLMLAAAMVVSTSPTHALAEAPANAASSVCENLTFSIHVNEKLLIISGTGNMPDYSLETAPWSSVMDGIQTVVIGPGITSIGANAFSCCNTLTSIVLPENLIRIGSCAFRACKQLQNVVFPESLTSVEMLAFDGCSKINTLIIPKNLSNIGLAAFTNIPLQHIQAAEDNPVFRSNEDVLYSKDGTQLLMYPIGRNEKFFQIPDGVTTIAKSAFEASTLTGIDIPESVTSIGDRAFIGSYHLTDLTLPEHLRSIGKTAFFGCSKLTSLEIPETVESMGGSVFAHCTSLESITFRGRAPSFTDTTFTDCKTTARYPANAGWTEADLQNYNGEIAWVLWN